MSAFWNIGQRPWAMDELELAYLRSSFLEPKDGEIQMLQHLSCFILLHPASRNGALVSLPTWWLGNLPDTSSACRLASQSKSESILYREDSLKSDWDMLHPILPYPLTKTGFFFGESDVSEKSKHLRPLQEPSDRRCEDADDICWIESIWIIFDLFAQARSTQNQSAQLFQVSWNIDMLLRTLLDICYDYVWGTACLPSGPWLGCTKAGKSSRALRVNCWSSVRGPPLCVTDSGHCGDGRRSVFL